MGRLATHHAVRVITLRSVVRARADVSARSGEDARLPRTRSSLTCSHSHLLYIPPCCAASRSPGVYRATCVPSGCSSCAGSDSKNRGKYTAPGAPELPQPLVASVAIGSRRTLLLQVHHRRERSVVATDRR